MIYFIDKSIPRPLSTNQNFTQWEKISRKIGWWIIRQLDVNLIERLDLSPTPVEFADDIYSSIKRMVTGTGLEDIGNNYLLATSMRREDYGTMEQFVNAFRQTVKQANRSPGTQIPPLAAALLLLRAIQNELPIWVTAIKLDIGKQNNTLTESELLDLYEKAIDQGRERERSYVAKSLERKDKIPKPKTSRSSSPSPNLPELSGTMKRRNEPPRDMSAIKWVESWLQGRQRDANNQCSFCNAGEHDTRNCWYLVPEKRRPYWKPYRSLWCYNPPRLSNLSKRPTFLPTESQSSKRTAEPDSEQSKMAIEPNEEITPFDMDHSMAFMAVENRENINPENYPSYRPWLSDTATSYFMCSEKTAMINYEAYGPDETNRPKFETANGEVGYAEGHGKCFIQLERDDGSTYDIITNCQYNPNISCNVFASHICMETHGIWVKSKDSTVRDMDTDKIIGYTYNINKLPYLRTVKPSPSPKSFAAVQAYQEHRRLAHCGLPKLKATAKAQGYSLKNIEFHCESCHLAKAKRQVSHDTPPRSKNIWDLYYADVQPIKPIGFSGYKYYLTIINDKYRVPEIRLLHQKGDASNKLIAFNKEFKNQTGRYISRWRFDDGSEFKHFMTWAKEKKRDMKFEPTPPRSPEPNGVPERWAGYLNQTARAMIIDAGLPAYLWPFAIDTAVYTVKRIVSPGETKSALQKYREDLGWSESQAKTTIKHLQIWGTRCYKHIPKEDRVQAEKMGPRAMIGYLVGYEGDNGHVYRIWDPKKRKIVRSRDVTFEIGKTARENEDPDLLSTANPKPPIVPNSGSSAVIDLRIPAQTRTSHTEIEDAVYTTKRLQTISQTPEADRPVQTIEPSKESHPVPMVPTSRTRTQESIPERVSSRHTKGIPPKKIEDEIWQQTARPKRPYNKKSTKSIKQTPASTGGVMFAIDTPPEGEKLTEPESRVKSHEITIPTNYREALQSPQKELWSAAMNDQIEKLESKNTYNLVDYPERDADVRVLPGKWVFDVKTDADNYILTYRARWVICGNRQREGLDFDNTYAPVVTETATKLALSAIAIHGLYAEQVDFVTAYLNAQLQGRKIYMRLPTGYYKNETNKVCSVLQALYGLKQSAFLWNNVLDEKLKKLGFKPLLEDPCVYIRTGKSFAIIYVDDAVIAALTKDEVDEIKRELNKDFPIKEIGELGKFLGCHVIRDYERGVITLTQAPYIEKILAEAGMETCWPTGTPLNPRYWKNEDETPTNTAEYQRLTGQFNWLVTKTRPDIAYAVSRLQRKNANPNTTDLQACKA